MNHANFSVFLAPYNDLDYSYYSDYNTNRLDEQTLRHRDEELKKVFRIIRENLRGNDDFADMRTFCSFKDYLKLSTEAAEFMERIYPCDDAELMAQVHRG